MVRPSEALFPYAASSKLPQIPLVSLIARPLPPVSYLVLLDHSLDVAQQVFSIMHSLLYTLVVGTAFGATIPISSHGQISTLQERQEPAYKEPTVPEHCGPDIEAQYDQGERPFGYRVVCETTEVRGYDPSLRHMTPLRDIRLTYILPRAGQPACLRCRLDPRQTQRQTIHHQRVCALWRRVQL